MQKQREMTPQQWNNRKGSLMILASAMLFSLGGLCVKVIPWAPLSINSARSLISCVILLLYLRVTKQSLKVTRGTLLGAVCVFGTTLLYACANKLTTAANTILLQYTAPIFIILFLWLFFHEKPRRQDVTACVFVFGGIACFFLDSLGTGGMLGNCLAIGAGVCYAGVFMMNRLPGGDPISSTILGQLLGGIVGIPSLFQEREFGAVAIFYVLVLGVLQMGVAYLCFCTGIRLTPPVTASLISGIEPILNPVLVAVFVHEMITPLSAVGGVVVLTTITLYNVTLAKQTKTPNLAQ